MFTFMQAAEGVQETMEQTKEIVSQVTSGDTSGLKNILHQCAEWAVESGKNILVAIVIYFVGRYLIKLLMKLMARMMERRKIDPTIQSFLRSFVKILLTTLLIITVVGALGVDTASFAALLASAGVAVGLALSGNLQNLAGGLIILLFRPYRVGDFIEAQGVSGTVKEIQIFHTVLVTVDNKIIYVPNGALSSGNVTNYSAMEQRRVDFTFSVEYGQDIQKVRDAIAGLIKADSRILQDPEPFIALGELSSSSIDFTVRVWVNSADYWNVHFGLRESVYNEFNKQGIGFPFPQITVHQA